MPYGISYLPSQGGSGDSGFPDPEKLIDGRDLVALGYATSPTTETTSVSLLNHGTTTTTHHYVILKKNIYLNPKNMRGFGNTTVNYDRNNLISPEYLMLSKGMKIEVYRISTGRSTGGVTYHFTPVQKK